MTTIIRSAIGSVASLGFLELLKELGFRVVGTDIVDEVAGLSLVDAFYKVPKANDGNSVVDCYNKIIEKENASWIISGPENEVEVLVKNRARLNAKVFHLPLDTFIALTDKYKLYKALSGINIRTPGVALLSERFREKIDSSLLVLKPRNGRGSAGVYIVEREKINIYLSLLEDKLSSYIVQEHITGKEISVDTLHDFKGNILNLVSRYRLNTESGISTISQTFHDNKLFSILEKLSEHFSFFGANCIQFIQDEKSKEYYLTDVNPRFGGGSILSLKASVSMRENLRMLFNDSKTGYDYRSYEYKELKMLRGFKEYYK